MKTDLLKEAIADADAIKKLAIENAKASLNESFDSKIKSMLAAKLQEDADQDMEDMEEEYDETDEAKKMDMEDTDETKHSKMDDEDTDESFDIDAILAEMEGDEEDDMKHEAKKKKASEEDVEDEEEDVEDEMEEPKASKRKKTSDDEEESGEDQMEETIDLDALIAEMMGEAEDDEVDEGSYSDDEDPMDETYGKDEDEDEEEDDKVQKMKEELYEIKRQAKQLAAKVNETNLINAKLLYLNKVLRNHTLSEQQKIKVVAAFDKASSVKEAKIVFESLNEALNIKSQNTKTSLKESLGFASKATGTSTKREIISESFADRERWQKLANIRK